MSEEQRYSKEGRAGWDPAVGQGKKGEKRQIAWTAKLKKILDETDNIDSDVQRIINTILDHENIPRKKPKFINFIKNIMGHRAGMHNIDKTWELFSQALKPDETSTTVPSSSVTSDSMDQVPNQAPEDAEMTESDSNVKKKKDKKNKKNKNKEQVEVEDVEPLKKSKKSKSKKKDERTSEKENVQECNDNQTGDDVKGAKKRKRDEVESMDIDGDTETPVKKTKFDWDEIITEILEAKDGNEMKLVKLKKKCLNEFFSRNEGTHHSKEDIGAKFDKKLKKRKYRILKDRVKLILNEEAVKDEEETNASAQTQEHVDTKPSLSFNKWEATDLGSSAQTDKFRRLMGIKSGAPPPKAADGLAKKRDDGKIFKDLEQGFEKARQSHFGGRCFDV